MVFDGEAANQPVFEIFHLFVGVDAPQGQDGIVDDRVVAFVNELSGREGDIARGVVALGVAFFDAHHRIDRLADLDLLAQRVAALEEQAAHRFVDNDCLAVIFHVVLVDEAAGREFDALDLLHLRERSPQPHLGELLAVSGFVSR